jgi:hypothetical protein
MRGKRQKPGGFSVAGPPDENQNGSPEGGPSRVAVYDTCRLQVSGIDHHRAFGGHDAKAAVDVAQINPEVE